MMKEKKSWSRFGCRRRRGWIAGAAALATARSVAPTTVPAAVLTAAVPATLRVDILAAAAAIPPVPDTAPLLV